MNTITLVGKMQDSLDAKTRLIELLRPEGDGSIKIPLRHWTREENTLLTTLKVGALVMIRGRIDVDPKIGIYVVAELINIIN